MPLRRIIGAAMALISAASLALGARGDAQAADQLGLPSWVWYVVAYLLVVGLLGWIIVGQHGELQGLRESRRLNLVVEVGDYDRNGYSIRDQSDDSYLEFEIPEFDVVNRSRTENINLRFTWRGTCSNFSPPEETTSYVPVAANTGWIANPLHLDHQSHRPGPFRIAIPFRNRQHIQDNGVVFVSGGWLQVKDELSGEEFEFPIPGRYESPPASSKSGGRR